MLFTAALAGACLRVKIFWDSTDPWRQEEVSAEAEGEVAPGEAVVAEEKEPVLQQTRYVLIAGLDDLENVHRSDTLILACFDSANRTVRLLSVPRDSRVAIPGRGRQKINHAYAHGGIDLLKRTVSGLLDVEIDNYVVVGFRTFPKIIDMLGGVELDVEKKLVYRDRAQGLYINIPAGRQTLDGKNALHYVRFRNDARGDIGRVGRQQGFVAALIKKVKSPLVWPRLPFIAAEALESVDTDLSVADAMMLARFAHDLPSGGIELFMLPGKEGYVDKLSYWLPDAEAAKTWLAGGTPSGHAAHIFAVREEQPPLDRDEAEELLARIGTISVLNGAGEKGLGKKASTLFQSLGVDVAHTGNASTFDYRKSSILYPASATADDLQAVKALAKLCGIIDDDAISPAESATMVSVVLGRDKEDVLHRLESARFQ